MMIKTILGQYVVRRFEPPTTPAQSGQGFIEDFVKNQAENYFKPENVEAAAKSYVEKKLESKLEAPKQKPVSKPRPTRIPKQVPKQDVHKQEYPSPVEKDEDEQEAERRRKIIRKMLGKGQKQIQLKNDKSKLINYI